MDLRDRMRCLPGRMPMDAAGRRCLRNKLGREEKYKAGRAYLQETREYLIKEWGNQWKLH